MRNLIKRLFCRHSDGTTFVRNIHGDEINTTGGKRSEWRCKRCDGLVLMDELNSGSSRALSATLVQDGKCPNMHEPRGCWRTVCQLAGKCRDPQRRQTQAQSVPAESIRSAAPAPAADDTWTNPLNPMSPLSQLHPLSGLVVASHCVDQAPAPSPSWSGSESAGSSSSCDGGSYSSDSGSSSSSSADW